MVICFTVCLLIMDEFELYLSFYMLYVMYLMIHKVNIMNSHSRRRWWVKPIHFNRDTHCYFTSTYTRLKDLDSEDFFKYTRMNRLLYEHLLQLLQEGLTKHSLRKPIVYECRLAITLSYLSQGVSHQFLAWSFHMGKSTIRGIILETCQLIWKPLQPLYVQLPSAADYESIAKGFWENWNIPHSVGAIDGKYINITCPPNTGSLYYDHKGNYSVVLLATCDYNYIFNYINVGSYGSQGDGGILSQTHFGHSLLNGTLQLPAERLLPKSDKKFPFYFVGDSAYPLKCNLMKPFPGKHLSHKKSIFNYRLSRARRMIENSFGILAARWRILLTTINAIPENVECIVLATVALHNYIQRAGATSQYCPPKHVDWEDENGVLHKGDWHNEVPITMNTVRMGSNNANRAAFKLRDKLADYFWNEGTVPFQ